MTMTFGRICVAGIAGGMFAAAAQGAVLADLTLEEWTNTEASGGSAHLDPPYTATSVLDANLDGVSGSSVHLTGDISTNHAVGGSGSNAGEINWADWMKAGDTMTNFFSIEVDPSAGFGVDLSDITFSIARNGAGAPDDLYVWVVAGSYAGAALDTVDAEDNILLTGAGLDVQNGGIVTNNPKAFDLSGVAQQDGLFSIVLGARGSAGDKIGNLRINDVVINGETVIVPEPGSLALLALGGLLIARRRRA